MKNSKYQNNYIARITGRVPADPGYFFDYHKFINLSLRHLFDRLQKIKIFYGY